MAVLEQQQIVIDKETKELVAEIEVFANMDIIQIRTIEDANAISFERNEIANRIKLLNEQRMKLTRPLDTAKKAIIDFFRKPVELLEKAESVRKRAIIDFQKEQDRIRREAEAKLQEEARKKAEALAAKAEKADEKGKSGKAEELRLQAEATKLNVPLIAPAPKIAGTTIRTIQSAEVTDKMELIKYIVKNPNFAMLLTPDTKMLKQLATSTKGTLQIPGVRFYSEQV